MKQKSGPGKAPAEQVLKDIRRQTRRQYSAEEKIRIVLEGLRGEENISELCRREGIAASMYYNWSKEFLEAGKKRLAGDTARAATTDEVKVLRRETHDLKEVVTEPALEQLGIPRATFHRWYDRFLTGGIEALEDRSPRPNRVWNRIPDDVRDRIV